MEEPAAAPAHATATPARAVAQPRSWFHHWDVYLGTLMLAVAAIMLSAALRRDPMLNVQVSSHVSAARHPRVTRTALALRSAVQQ